MAGFFGFSLFALDLTAQGEELSFLTEGFTVLLSFEVEALCLLVSSLRPVGDDLVVKFPLMVGCFEKGLIGEVDDFADFPSEELPLAKGFEPSEPLRTVFFNLIHPNLLYKYI